MGLLQKIYEFFSKLGELQIMMYPVMAIFVAIALAWYNLRGYVPAWAIIAIMLLILVAGISYCYFAYLRPWLSKHRATEVAAREE